MDKRMNVGEMFREGDLMYKVTKVLDDGNYEAQFVGLVDEIVFTEESVKEEVQDVIPEVVEEPVKEEPKKEEPKKKAPAKRTSTKKTTKK